MRAMRSHPHDGMPNSTHAMHPHDTLDACTAVRLEAACMECASVSCLTNSMSSFDARVTAEGGDTPVCRLGAVATVYMYLPCTKNQGRCYAV
eukprot:364728-Chlamydomonas_euryale.AAC.3